MANCFAMSNDTNRQTDSVEQPLTTIDDIDTAVEQLVAAAQEHETADDVTPDAMRAGLVELQEFNLPLSEAMRSVCRKFAIPVEAVGGDSQTRSEPESPPSADCDLLNSLGPDDWGTVEVTVNSIANHPSDSIAQAGTIADASGSREFVAWATSDLPSLTENESYRLASVVGNEYQGATNIALNSQTEVTRLDSPIDAVDPTSTVCGLVTALKDGSGLIKRCPRDGCDSVLSENRCPTHGSVDTEFDLRVELAVDIGQQSITVRLDQELTTELTGLTLEAATQRAKKALDTDVVFTECQSQLVGRYLRVSGTTFQNALSATEATLLTAPLSDMPTDQLLTATDLSSIGSRRQPTHLVTGAELNSMVYQFTPDDDRDNAPNLFLSPTGMAANRVAIAGVLLKAVDVGQDDPYLKATVVTPDGETVSIFAGQYEPDALGLLQQVDCPTRVVVIGKPNTYTDTDDPDEMIVSVTPESIITSVTKSDVTLFAAVLAARTEMHLANPTASLPQVKPDLARSVYTQETRNQVSDSLSEAVSDIRDRYDIPTENWSPKLSDL